jgi:hypothetical protein
VGFSFGPRILRIHVNKRGVGLSSGVGWFSVSGHTSSGRRARSGTGGADNYRPPTRDEIDEAKASEISKLRNENWILLEGKDAPAQLGLTSFLACRDRDQAKSGLTTSTIIWLVLLFPVSWAYYGFKYLRDRNSGSIEYRHYYLDSGLNLHWRRWRPTSEKPNLTISNSSLEMRQLLDREVEKLFGSYSIVQRDDRKAILASRVAPENAIVLEVSSSGFISKRYSKTSKET